MKKHLYFLCCFFAFFLSARAQQPFIREFTLSDHQTPIAIHDMALSETGHLWLATENGLYRWNGKNFLHIPDSIGVPATSVYTHHKEVWVGYQNGHIGLFKNGRVIPYKQNTLRHSGITSLHVVSHQIIIASTEDKGAFCMINGQPLYLDRENGLPDNYVYDIAFLNNHLLLATDQGISILHTPTQHKQLKHLNYKDGLPDNIVRVIEAVPNSAYCWIGCQENGIAIYQTESHQLLTLPLTNPWPWGAVNAILPESSQKAWVATELGYLLDIYLDKDSFDVQPYAYPGMQIHKLLKDNAGNLWMATQEGLVLNTIYYASYINIPDATNGTIAAIALQNEDMIWYAQGKKLLQLVMRPKIQQRLAAQLPEDITCIYYDKAFDRIWIGTFGEGLFMLHQGKITPIEHIPTIRKGHILSITSSRDNLWVSSLNGVEEINLHNWQRWKHHHKASGIGSDYVYQLYTDEDNNIWMATDGAGICRYDGKTYYSPDSSTGFHAKVVYSFSSSKDGQKLAASLDNGVFITDRQQWHQDSMLYQLFPQGLLSICTPSQGLPLCIEKNGIFQWDPQTGQLRNLHSFLPASSTIPDVLNCYTVSKEGYIYTPVGNGILKIHPTNSPIDIRPSVSIHDIQLFFKPISKTRTQFAHADNHFSFHFDAYGYNSGRYYYRYKLEGFENNWVYTQDEQVSFAQLPPGNYTFYVQASGTPSFQRAHIAQYSFTILHPFWMRPIFIICMSLAAILLIWMLIKFREKKLNRQSQLQKMQMTYEYEYLKSQVNPHFLFNSLNTLMSLIEENPKNAVHYTNHLSDLYRNTLAYKDKELILLAEEMKILSAYLYIQKSRFEHALQMEINIPEDILCSRKIIPMALQLIVENAIKHNIVSITKPLQIQIYVEGACLWVSNRLQPKLHPEKGAGVALENIRRRYHLLSGKTVFYGIQENSYKVSLPLL
jgi:ligand-binding sensor domain-containing protein